MCGSKGYFSGVDPGRLSLCDADGSLNAAKEASIASRREATYRSPPSAFCACGSFNIASPCRHRPAMSAACGARSRSRRMRYRRCAGAPSSSRQETAITRRRINPVARSFHARRMCAGFYATRHLAGPTTARASPTRRRRTARDLRRTRRARWRSPDRFLIRRCRVLYIDMLFEVADDGQYGARHFGGALAADRAACLSAAASFSAGSTTLS